MLKLRKGNALIAVIVAMVVMAIVIAGLAVFQMFFLRSLQGRSAESQNKTASRSVAEYQYRNLVNKAALSLGVITQTDLDTLNANLRAMVRSGQDSAITGGGIVKIDTLLSTDSMVFAHGAFTAADTALVPLPYGPGEDATNDWPRRGFQYNYDVGGLLGFKTGEVMIRSVVRGRRGSITTTTARVAFYKIPAYQHALYTTSATMELCEGNPIQGFSGRRGVINGSVWADGDISVACPDSVTIGGSLYAQRDIDVTSGVPATVVVDSNRVSLTQILRTTVEQNVDGILQAFHGIVHSGGAVAGPLVSTHLQDAKTNGVGECADGRMNWPNQPPFWRDSLACSNTSAYLPALHVSADSVYRTSGTGAISIVCGQAPTTAGECGTLSAMLANGGSGGLTYTYMYPPAYDGISDNTAIFPTANVPWRGILADTRREMPCQATIGTTTFATLRCKTNAYGYVWDLGTFNSAVPAGGIPGGLVDFSLSTDARNRAFQEVLVLKNGSCLNNIGPLTIHSQLPVYIVGNLNLDGCGGAKRVPLLIDAPLITVLPTESVVQLQRVNRWDDVSGTTGAGIQPLRAYSSVQVNGVFRSYYHAGTAFGGTFQQIPSVMGDWSRNALHILGGVYGVEVAAPAQVDSVSNSIGIRAYFSATSPILRNLQTKQPKLRQLDYDRRLLTVYANLQPPGSWLPQNIPHAVPDTVAWPLSTRSGSRQTNAIGGFSVPRLTQGYQTVNGAP